MWRDPPLSMTPSIPERIGDYVITRVLGRGAMSVVYCGQKNGQDYAVKVMTNRPSIDAVDIHLLFRREAAAIARLDHPSLVRVIEVGELESRPYLVMELVEGEALDQRIAHAPLTDDAVIALTRCIAEGLAEVHRFGLVHRDVKPANIVVGRDGAARLIDFGLVSGVTDPEAVVGTLPYAAPEQVGVLGRPVGAPADLYSLGATMFQCLTGEPPLKGATPSDFLHVLATVPAPDLRVVRPATRPGLAAVVAKLLAKDPDDRYQSAHGLLADLAQLVRLDEVAWAGGTPVLGTRDAPISGDTQVPLVGRAEELDRLARAWTQVKRGFGGVALILGESGSGKSRLAREVAGRAAAEGAIVLSGKCQELETVPLGPLREAADDFAARILRLHGAERAQAEALVRAAAGEWAPLVRRLSVGIARVIGETGEVRAFDPDAEQQRYYEALASFFRNLGRPSAPLCLVVDDVQWLDEGSLRVLSRMAAGATTTSMLVLATSRDHLGCEPANARFVEAAGAALVERLHLGPLSDNAVGAIVTARLGGRPLDAGVVARLGALTHGNAFAVGEYLRALLDSGALRPVDGAWRADRAALDAVLLPKDVVALVVSRLSTLPRETLRLVGIAGVLGNRFQAELLGEVAGRSADSVARAMEEMTRAGLVERGMAQGWAFVHDRVRESAVERLGEAERRDAHQAVAEVLDRRGQLDATQQYALARHYAQGHVDRNPRRVAEANLEAGLRAVDDHANEEAFELLDRALSLSRAAGIYEELAPRLLEGLGRVCALTGRLDRAFAHLEEALQRTSDPKDHFRLQYLLTLTFASQGRNGEALEALYAAFAVMGRPLPRWIGFQVLALLWIWPMALILRWTGIGHGRAKGDERRERQVLSQLHYAGSMIALFQGDPILMVQFIVRDFYNVHFLGPTAETAVASTVYGAVMGLAQLEGLMRHYTRMGVEMGEQLGDRPATAIARVYEALGTKWAGDVVKGTEMLVEALPELNREVPGSWYAAMMICEQSYSYLHQGRSHAAIAHIEGNRQQLDRTNNLMFRYNVYSVQYAEMMLTGDVVAASALWETLERQFAPMSTTIYVRLARAMALMEVLADQGETGPEVDEAIAAFHDLVSEDYYSNAARMQAGYARMVQYEAASPAERPAARRRFEAEIRGLALRAIQPVYRCNVMIWRAVLAREDGKLLRAARLLIDADRMATASNSRRGAFHVARERARVSRLAGDSSASAFAMLALEIATAEGWRNQAARVRAEFNISELHAAAGPTAMNSTTRLTRTGEQARRYADALLQVSLASASTLDLDVQARNALTEVARVLGAERALFFLVEPTTGELQLKASTGAGAETISHTIVRRVIATREPLVHTGTDDGAALGSESILMHGLRSVMAAPLLFRDRLIGVVYLDSRLARGMFTEDDVDILLGVSNHIAIAIETARSARVEAERSALQRDFELAGAVQSLLLPKSPHVTGAGLRGLAFYQPASQCGGDWWWSETQADGSLLLLLGDVSGHGAAPAMITSAVAGAFHTLREVLPGVEPTRILEEIDRRVRAFGGGFHMTLSVVHLDAAQASLRWWGAAAPPIFVLRNGTCVPLHTRGSVLGDVSALEIGELSTSFGPGDRLLLTTDGLLEAQSVDGRELGARRVSKLFAQLGPVPVDEVPARLGAHVNQLLGGRTQADDITFLVVEAMASARPHPPSPTELAQ